MSDVLTLSLTCSEYPVELDGTAYKLRELNGIDRDNWMEFITSKTKYDEKGNAVGMKSFQNVQATLISKCLIGPDGKPVPEKLIATWPARVQTALFNRCQEINGLTQAGVDEAKKD